MHCPGGHRGDRCSQRPDVGQNRRGGLALVLQVEHPFDGGIVAIFDRLAANGEFRGRVAPRDSNPPGPLVLGQRFSRVRLHDGMAAAAGLPLYSSEKKGSTALSPKCRWIHACWLAQSAQAATLSWTAVAAAAGLRKTSGTKNNTATVRWNSVLIDDPFLAAMELWSTDDRITSSQAKVTPVAGRGRRPRALCRLPRIGGGDTITCLVGC